MFNLPTLLVTVTARIATGFMTVESSAVLSSVGSSINQTAMSMVYLAAQQFQ
jgi:hypothetical protein